MDRRTFTFASLAAGLPIGWLRPATELGLTQIAGVPIVGAWSAVVPKDGLYRVLVDGMTCDQPAELALFQNSEEIGGIVRAPKVGEGGEFVVGTRIIAKAGDRIALDCSDEIELMSMPRLALIPLSYDPAVMARVVDAQV